MKAFITVALDEGETDGRIVVRSPDGTETVLTPAGPGNVMCDFGVGKVGMVDTMAVSYEPLADYLKRMETALDTTTQNAVI